MKTIHPSICYWLKPWQAHPQHPLMAQHFTAQELICLLWHPDTYQNWQQFFYPPQPPISMYQTSLCKVLTKEICHLSMKHIIFCFSSIIFFKHYGNIDWFCILKKSCCNLLLNLPKILNRPKTAYFDTHEQLSLPRSIITLTSQTVGLDRPSYVTWIFMADLTNARKHELIHQDLNSHKKMVKMHAWDFFDHFCFLFHFLLNHILNIFTISVSVTKYLTQTRK